MKSSSALTFFSEFLLRYCQKSAKGKVSLSVQVSQKFLDVKTPYNMCSVMWGILSTVGDAQYRGGVQYNGGGGYKGL